MPFTNERYFYQQWMNMINSIDCLTKAVNKLVEKIGEREEEKRLRNTNLLVGS